jgi:hypothetical protein
MLGERTTNWLVSNLLYVLLNWLMLLRLLVREIELLLLLRSHYIGRTSPL